MQQVIAFAASAALTFSLIHLIEINDIKQRIIVLEHTKISGWGNR